MNLNKYKKWFDILEPIKDIIIEKYNNGETYLSLEKEYKIDRKAISIFLKNNNIKKTSSCVRLLNFKIKNISDDTKRYIIEEYTNNKRSIRGLTKELNIKSNIIKQILKINNVYTNKRHRDSLKKNGWVISDKQKYNMTISFIKIPGFTEEYIRSFDDINKFQFLRKLLAHHCPEYNNTKWMKKFFNKFYYDKQFNKYYDNWINVENKAEYAKPSLDHIIPLSKGGTWDLNNLQIIPWCVNRAKYNYMPEEWKLIKEKIFN